jgi:alpha-beta hydrolase superfamily lysophospholipase
MGVEYVSSHRAIRSLATRLESAGYLVLRFDYEATGDSCGDESEPGQLAAWLASVRAGVAFVRECGAQRVGLVGFRIGGTLAAVEAVRDGDIEALVLWDPCPTGRSFIREQEALKFLSIGELPAEGVMLDPGAVEVLGAVLSAEAMDHLGALDMTTLDQPLARRTLVLVRDDRPTPSRLRQSLGTEDVEWGVAVGQADLVDVLPDLAVQPEEAIDTVAKWLTGALGAEPQTIVPVVRDEAMVSPPCDGTLVCERTVRLGPLGLFGIVTEPPNAPVGPTLVFLNAGLIHHIGPARLWVSLSRRFAAAGIRCLRFDLSGLGDSPIRPGQAAHIGYPLEAGEDVASAVGAMSSNPSIDVVLAGLCAGAYHSIEYGIALSTRGVCAINPILSFDPPEVGSGGMVDAGRLAVQPFNGWVNRLRRFQWLATFGEYRAPPAVWWLLDRIGVQAHPARGLEALATQGVSTLLICGESEARPFQRRAKWAMRRMTEAGALRFEVLPAIDHTLFGASARSRATSLITEHVLSTYLTMVDSDDGAAPLVPDLVRP